MLNNLSFRDKLIIFILTILVVIGLFIFAFYRPFTAKIKELKPQRVTAMEEADKIFKQVGDTADKNGEGEEIRYTPSDRNHYAGSSYARVLDDYETAKVSAKDYYEQFSITPPDKLLLDDMIKKLADENRLMIKSVNFSDATPTSISYYTNSPTDPWLTKSYDLRKSLDTLVGGKISTENEKEFAYSNSIAALGSQTILATTVNLTFRATSDDIFLFLDKIAVMGERKLVDVKDKDGKVIGQKMEFTSDSAPGEGIINGTVWLDNYQILDYTFGVNSDNTWEKGFSDVTTTLTIFSVSGPPTDKELTDELFEEVE